MQSLFREAENLIVKDINTALTMFSDGLWLAGECVKKTIYTGRERKKVWFDAECRESRKHLRKTLKKFCTSQCDEERQNICNIGKSTKNCFVRKKQTIKTL